VIRHPAALATVGAGTVLVAASTVTAVPGWMWVAWAALGVVAVVEAVRDRQ
jgi:hypothetical protein